MRKVNRLARNLAPLSLVILKKKGFLGVCLYRSITLALPPLISLKENVSFDNSGIRILILDHVRITRIVINMNLAIPLQTKKRQIKLFGSFFCYTYHLFIGYLSL